MSIPQPATARLTSNASSSGGASLVRSSRSVTVSCHGSPATGATSFPDPTPTRYADVILCSTPLRHDETARRSPGPPAERAGEVPGVVRDQLGALLQHALRYPGDRSAAGHQRLVVGAPAAFRAD